MANSTTVVTLIEQPLQNADAGALNVDTYSPDVWQPAVLLESPQTAATVAGSNLDSSGNRWQLLCAPKAPYPNYVFMCIAMRASVTMPSTTEADTFFKQDFCFSIEGGCDDNVGLWQRATGETPFTFYDGSSLYRLQTFSPELRGYPPRPFRPTSDTVVENSLGGMEIQIDTWDATVGASATVTVDARFLGFPQAVVRSAGLYVPRLYAKLN